MTDATAPANTPLEELPNLGKTTVMWLRAIGIKDRQTLGERGIYWAYQRMQARRFRVTSAVLFSLEGALQDRPWRTFTAAEKDTLLRRLARYERRPDPAHRPVPQAAPKRGTNHAGQSTETST